jgi:hypothetical protein
MANIDAVDLTYKNQMAHTFGNAAVAHGRVAAVQPAATDVVRLMRLPKGCKLMDAWFGVSVAADATATADFGFTHVDGSAGDDPDYFSAAPHNVNTGTFYRADAGIEPVELTKDSYITLTIATAGWSSDTVLYCVVFYEFVGLE